MARIPYASPEQYEELMRDIRLPEDAAPTNAIGMLAHAPAIGGSALKLIHSILTAADLDFFLHELVILRVSQRIQAWYAWTQHIAIAQAIGLSDLQSPPTDFRHSCLMRLELETAHTHRVSN